MEVVLDADLKSWGDTVRDARGVRLRVVADVNEEPDDIDDKKRDACLRHTDESRTRGKVSEWSLSLAVSATSGHRNGHR